MVYFTSRSGSRRDIANFVHVVHAVLEIVAVFHIPYAAKPCLTFFSRSSPLGIDLYSDLSFFLM